MKPSSRSNTALLDFKKPRIVASLGENAAEDIKALEGADMVELRLDLVDGDPLEAVREIRKTTSLPLIITNRMKSEGGQFRGSEEERISILLKASTYSDFVDIELQSVLRDKVLSKAEKPVIISYHHFSRMPLQEELRSIMEEMKRTGAEIAKIAVTPSSLKDNLEILSFLLEADMPLCMIAMGEMGRHLRAVAPIYGSVLTYGYVSQATAPGQMSVSELKQAIGLLSQTAHPAASCGACSRRLKSVEI